MMEMKREMITMEKVTMMMNTITKRKKPRKEKKLKRK